MTSAERMAAELKEFHDSSEAVSWSMVGLLLGTSKGAAYSIAHGTRRPNKRHVMRWNLAISTGIANAINTEFAEVPPCPTCGEVHAIADCHGQPGTVAWKRAKPRPPAWVTQAADWLQSREDVTK